MEMLNQRQATKKELIERCLTGEISTLDAAILTGLTRRAIQKTSHNINYMAIKPLYMGILVKPNKRKNIKN